MVRYEALVLAVPTLTQDEAKNIESQISRVVAENKGSMISFERWGKYRLAYPIKKNEYGVYFLARFEAEKNAAIVSAVKNLMIVKLNDTVMRDMVNVLPATASLAYHRPQSLEEVPSRESAAAAERNAASSSDDMQDLEA